MLKYDYLASFRCSLYRDTDSSRVFRNTFPPVGTSSELGTQVQSSGSNNKKVKRPAPTFSMQHSTPKRAWAHQTAGPEKKKVHGYSWCWYLALLEPRVMTRIKSTGTISTSSIITASPFTCLPLLSERAIINRADASLFNLILFSIHRMLI